jgi:hypothetical protein
MSNLLQSEAKGSTAVEYLPRHDHAWAVGANPILRQSGRNRQTTVGSQESAASRIDGELLKTSKDQQHKVLLLVWSFSFANKGTFDTIDVLSGEDA